VSPHTDSAENLAMNTPQPADAPTAAAAPRRWPWLLAVALVALGLGLFWWMNRGHTSTDDAYIQANITMIAPRISGTVVRVPVTDNQRVEAGALLFELDPADHEARLRQVSADLTAAEARVQVARAELDMTRTRAPAALAQAAAAVRSARARAEKAAADERRYEALFAKDQIPRQVLEQARSSHLALQAEAEGVQAGLRGAQTLAQQIAAQEAALASAEAAVAQAQAARDQAALQLRYCRVTAPVAGRVTRKNVLPGSQVQMGTPVLALVGDQPWVVANFKETQLEDLRVGQPVEIEVDAYPGRHFSGRVDSLQAGTGSAFSLLPPENASGNFVKVVQRVPVKLVFDPAPDPALHLAPGMSVIPRVDLREQGGARLAEAPP
jgi:membrane fusion protein, multidrug efflux system